MAVQHIAYVQTASHAHLIRQALGSLETGYAGLNNVIGTMALMIDGDPGLAASFVYMADKFGFADGAAAKGAYEELLSLQSKLIGNGSVSNVNAALLQAFNKLRV